MGLELIGAAASWNTLRARHVLLEKGIRDVHLTILNLGNGEQKKPDHIAKNPLGKVPVLIDGNLTVFESRAIARYIATKHRNSQASLTPDSEDLDGIALFEQAASIETTFFDAIAQPLVLKHAIARFRGTTIPEDEISSSTEELAPKLTTLDKILSSQTYMAGNHFSLVDAFYMPLFYLLMNLGFHKLLEERPHLKSWWVNVTQRDAWKEAVEPFNKVYGF